MLRLSLFILGTYAVFVFQTSLSRECAVAGIVPHLPCATLMLIGLLYPGRSFLLGAAVWGLLSDLLGDGRIGAGSASFALAAAAIGSVLQSAPRQSALLTAISGGLIVLVCNLLYAAVPLAVSGGLQDLSSLWSTIIRQALYTGLIAFVLVFFLRRFTRHNSTDSRSDDVDEVSNRWSMLTE